MNTGVEPAGLKWNRITTQHFHVIYPKGFETQARVYASKLEKSYFPVSFSLNTRPPKFTYVYHPFSAMSNGMTAVAPNKVEVWAKPYQDSYGQAWDEQLIIHEGRHVAQFTSMYRGASKLPIWFFGQMGYAFPIGLFVPNWFMEGDAVATETALSEYGRGRQPSFEKGMRAYLLERGNPGYDKMMLGSYNDHIPNHYETGYHIVAANRVFRDSAIFSTKMERIARYPWYIFPFARSINGLKDTRKVKYYKFAADTLKKLWRAQDKWVAPQTFPLVYYTKNYSGLERLQESNGKLYAFRSALSDIPQFVEISGKRELTLLLEAGYNAEKYFSMQRDTLVYATEVPHPQWEQVSKSVLYSYDIVNKRNNRITGKGSFFAPAIHPSKSIVAAVEITNKNEYFVSVIDVKTGEITSRLPNAENQFIITPQWTEDGSGLVYIKITPQGKALFYNNMQEEKLIFGPSKTDFKHPIVKGDAVYFSGDWSGIENIYRVSLNGGEPLRLTNSRFGATSPVFSGDTLCFLDYTSRGNFVVRLSDTLFVNEPLKSVRDFSPNLADKLAKQEQGVITFDEPDSVPMKIKKYNKFWHQFNFHSWFPVAGYQLNEGAYIPGISFVSQSMLNDATLAVGANLTNSEMPERFYVNYIYRGTYPVLHLNAYFAAKEFADYRYNHLRFNAKAEFPLSFSKLGYNYQISPAVLGDYIIGARTFDSGYDQIITRNIGGMFSFTRRKQLAYKDLLPAWGQQFNLFYQKGSIAKPTNSDRGSSWGGEAKLYFPGILKHHSLQLMAGYHKYKTYNYNLSFAPVIYTPFGMDNYRYNQMFRQKMEYLFPVSTIDAEIFWLVNIKRLNASFWIDRANFDYGTYSIFGSSVFCDVNFFRYPIDFKVGLKAGYSQTVGRPFAEIIFTTEL